MNYRVKFIDGSIVYTEANCSSSALIQAVEQQAKLGRSTDHKYISTMKYEFSAEGSDKMDLIAEFKNKLFNKK